MGVGSGERGELPVMASDVRSSAASSRSTRSLASLCSGSFWVHLVRPESGSFSVEASVQASVRE